MPPVVSRSGVSVEQRKHPSSESCHYTEYARIKADSHIISLNAWLGVTVALTQPEINMHHLQGNAIPAGPLSDFDKIFCR